jgi:PIN domain nuclease of toxin-antitoxin system
VRLLLDTQALLWFYLGDPQLSPAAQAAIVDPDNTKSVSPASFWEIAIKLSIGKYALKEPYDDFIQHAIHDNGFDILAIEPRHTAALVTLPFDHKDPFDRLLAAQAIVEGIGIVSSDAILDKYGVRRIW